MQKKWISDWLNLKPIFYNEKTLKVSHNINEVIDNSDIEFHPEGLLNYLEFGYSAFGQTPLKNVKFLEPCSELSISNAKIKIKKLKDPAERVFSEKPTSIDEVVKLIKGKLDSWVDKQSDKIILPMSGGLDSRMLALLINSKKKLSCFTYGTSPNQKRSFEVGNAKIFCKKYNIQWGQIPIGDCLNYLDEWDNLFGISTHAHGMYHLEFYKKIRNKGFKGNPLLSGIVGDAWVGSLPKKKVSSYKEISKLTISHGANANQKFCKLKTNYELRKEFFNKNKEKLKNWAYQNITSIRLKMILLSYLFTIPEKTGFKPFSPFMDQEVVIKMLCLPDSERENRAWQKNLFKRSNISTMKNPLKMDFRNNLDYQMIKKFKFKKLRYDLLKDLFEEEYINWINKELGHYSIKDRFFEGLFTIPRIGKLIEKRLKKGNRKLVAYNAYLTIKPLENLIMRGNDEEIGK
jgi:asparagine synthetase B (glutamine-hydrolysing)